MDNKKILEFVKANPYASKLILALAEEYKPEGVTKVYEAVAVLEAYEISVSYSQIVALFRQLENLGCGTFFVGRKGKKSRFLWRIDIKTIGKEIEDNSSDGGPSPKTPEHSEGASSTRSDAILRHTFHLRQNFELVLSLPADLTEKDAQRIAKFVESLPQ